MTIGTLAGALLAADRARPRLSSLQRSAGLYRPGCIPAAPAPTYGWFACALVLTP